MYQILNESLDDFPKNHWHTGRIYERIFAEITVEIFKGIDGEISERISKQIPRNISKIMPNGASKKIMEWKST